MPSKQRLSPRPEATNGHAVNSAEHPIIRFIEQIRSTSFLKPDGRPDRSWLLFTARTWEKADELATSAAGFAKKDGAIDDKYAIPHPKRPSGMERSAYDAVLVATSRLQPISTGWKAADDASLMVRAFLADEESGDLHYVRLASARWEVWQKGYWLSSEFNGRLYVAEQKGMVKSIYDSLLSKAFRR